MNKNEDSDTEYEHLGRRDCHTPLSKLFNTILEAAPHDTWLTPKEIYEIVRANMSLLSNDFFPSRPKTAVPRWKRNVRHALRLATLKGVIKWDKRGHYLINSNDNNEVLVRKRCKITTLECYKALLERQECIGRKGEEFVVEYERKRLKDESRYELAKEVKQISLGDVGRGYDI